MGEKEGRYSEIHQVIKQMIEENTIWGASYGFVGRESGAFCQGVQGAVEPWSKRQLLPGMLYDLASLTKVVGTTTRILQLIDMGELDFFSSVQSIIAEFRYPEVRVENLLLHNSGLPAEIGKKGPGRDELLKGLFSLRLQEKPGASMCYSDPGFILLGMIVQAMDGCSLEESFQEHIFRPLGMKDTSYHPQGELSRFLPEEYRQDRGWVCGEVHDSKAYLLGESGSAGLFSTLEDMMTFAEVYVNRDERLFSRAVFEAVERTEAGKRGYGWSMEYGPGILYHTGFTGTSMLLDMKRKEGFVLLTNRIHPSRDNTRFLEQRKVLNRMWLEQK